MACRRRPRYFHAPGEYPRRGALAILADPTPAQGRCPRLAYRPAHERHDISPALPFGFTSPMAESR
jgi:hypothetical protein